ncbi:hypothetical protein BGZ70_005979, partial [Mortierella alpina]
MVVDEFNMEEPEEIDDELEAIPVKVYEQDEPVKDKNVTPTTPKPQTVLEDISNKKKPGRPRKRKSGRTHASNDKSEEEMEKEKENENEDVEALDV